jgi:hypothetical protein
VFASLLISIVSNAPQCGYQLDFRTDIHDQFTYLQYALWYEAENGGFIDSNIVVFAPQIVRFRPDRVPAAATFGLLNSPQKFD